MSPRIVLVIEQASHWPLELEGVEVVSARDYLTSPSYSERRARRVFNLCRSYRYQSLGYYVSLLAEARDHRPLPDVATIQDLKSPSHVRRLSEEVDAILQRSLAPISSDRFTLSVYFGRNLASRHDRLARALFGLFPAPLLRAELRRESETVEGGEVGAGPTDRDPEGTVHRRWQLTSLRPIALNEVPEAHRPFLEEAAQKHFRIRRQRRAQPKSYRYDLALLVDPKAELGPSNERALRKIERHGERLGIGVERIGKDDFSRLLEFDALLIRETTAVDHYTYRFARRAAASGMVVLDDPDSILRCTNKVYLTELLNRHGVPIPRTLVVHRDNVDAIAETVGLPAVLKLPDGSFSKAVVKATEAETCRQEARRFLEQSDLLVAQEYLPTDFDWRLGVLDRQPLFAARYRMARGHWQIARHSTAGPVRYGGVDAIPLTEVPAAILETGLRAANLIGDGFYGVDLKEIDGRAVVIEVNDNPNLDAGEEDTAEGEVIYQKLLGYFLSRLEKLKRGES